MDMTTTARVGALVNTTSGTGSAQEVVHWAALITSISAEAERYMDRYAQSGSRTEYLPVEPGQRTFRLRGYPISSVTTVRYDPDQVFASGSDVDYYSPVNGNDGLLVLKATLEPECWQPGALAVTYTGGMAADVTAFVDAFPDIAGAIDQAVVRRWKQRDAFGVASVGGDGGSVTFETGEWASPVREVLDRYRRHYAG